MSVFVDFVGFEQPAGIFAVKELAIQPLSVKEQISVVVFEPPCPKNQLSEEFQSTVEIIERNSHGMPWDGGEMNHEQVNKIIEEKIVGQYEYIFVKGVEKKNWLSIILKYHTLTIINLDDMGCPETQELQCQPAIRHSFGHPLCKKYNCAYENVQRYRNWYSKEFSPRPNLRKSITLFCAVDKLSDMCAKDIAKLPIIAISRFGTTEIESVWDKLSEEQKQHQTIAGWRRCKDHPLNHDDDFGDIVGFLYFSYVKDCIHCNSKKRKLNEE